MRPHRHSDASNRVDRTLRRDEPDRPGGAWPEIEELREDANYNFKRQDAAAIKALANHKRLGVWVVIVSAVVSTSVFGALAQKNPIVVIQIGTGILSLLATVLAATQTFYEFSTAANIITRLRMLSSPCVAKPICFYNALLMFLLFPISPLSIQDLKKLGHESLR